MRSKDDLAEPSCVEDIAQAAMFRSNSVQSMPLGRASAPRQQRKSFHRRALRSWRVQLRRRLHSKFHFIDDELVAPHHLRVALSAIAPEKSAFSEP
ncbi:hypothetical protein HAP47_0030080 [Bradyrhizobium sp. 41S5]|uniref:hypothetical protein n=1 Tax=Bradyrhizobium sp. 41S5 TaxID=1404443 RepID=UPI00156A99ED|nr:hypothetical protein [Bradyrhizobium sp. 41S5]UFX43441.1 hypothetical protein HAP47_0030080 [Bradyrhizobium sp. 41S5]